MSKSHKPFDDPAVKAVFDDYPEELRDLLLQLRSLIFTTARETAGVGELAETLKWRQPAYLPLRPRTGTTIRIDAVRNQPDRYAMLVHCQTSLIENFRTLYPDKFEFQGNRALLFSTRQSIPLAALKHCIALSLTYHLKATQR